MEKVVHLFEIFKIIFYFIFLIRQSTFLIDQSLEMFEIVLNNLNSGTI
jgi:hypothetical protein